VQVTNDAITGYAWSKNYGWINLSPTNGEFIILLQEFYLVMLMEKVVAG